MLRQLPVERFSIHTERAPPQPCPLELGRRCATLGRPGTRPHRPDAPRRRRQQSGSGVEKNRLSASCSSRATCWWAG